MKVLAVAVFMIFAFNSFANDNNAGNWRRVNVWNCGGKFAVAVDGYYVYTQTVVPVTDICEVLPLKVGEEVAHKQFITVKDGRLNGKRISYNPDGSVSWEANYTDGRLNGYMHVVRDDGSVLQRFYVDGKIIEENIVIQRDYK